jgi:hypothetical protein
MADTYELISSTTLTASTNAVTFTSIPQTYTDLVMTCAYYEVTNNGDCRLSFNGDTSTTHDSGFIYRNGTSGWSAFVNQSGEGWAMQNINDTALYPLLVEIFIGDYATTSKFKTYLMTSGTGGGGWPLTQGQGTWRSTSAITSLSWRNTVSTNLATGSVISLYGIARA